MDKARILVVDDEEGMLEVCVDILRKLPGAVVVPEVDSRRAATRITSERWDLLMADIRMPGLNGVDLLRIARGHDPTLPVLMLTAFPNVETAVETLKLGAADYVAKPFLPDDLLATVRRILEEKRLREENRLLERQAERRCASDELVGSSPAMQPVLESIERASETDVDVLITGETGVGKELVARSIHKGGRRKSARFVPVDCGAIPENLLESEFFGHERGAFTGAPSQAMGLLEFADGGTFFLDEIAELPLQLQAKLLRTLQERKFRRVGGKEEISVDVRVMAATNRDLISEVRSGRFREDLYYRIDVARIEIPPLRERASDIPFLIAHFIDRYARDMQRTRFHLDAEVMKILTRYPWPGNVRELQNFLKRALAMTRCELFTIDDLPDELLTRAFSNVPDKCGNAGFFHLRSRRLEAFEKKYLTSLARKHAGDMSRAAEEAKVPRGTLYRLLGKYGLAPEDFRPRPTGQVAEEGSANKAAFLLASS